MVVAAWYRTGAEEDAWPNQAWEHQVPTVEEGQNDVPCLCLCRQVWEKKALEEDWYQTVVVVVCFRLEDSRLGEAGGEMCHSARCWDANGEAAKNPSPN